MTSARNWPSLVDHEEIGLDDKYYAAICVLAAIQANEEEGEEEASAPDTSDVAELIEIITNTDKPNPAWWPRKLDRIEIIIKVKPEGNTSENIGPHPLDPNTPSGDLGRGTFNSMLKGMLEMAGIPFEGSIQIRILRRSNRSVIGGWKGNIFVGETEKKEKGKSGKRGAYDDERDDLFDYLKERAEKQDEVALRLISNSANVIHASASAINALRGANVAPPWMQGGAGGEEEPIWMTLAKGAADMVIKAGLEDQGLSPGQAAGQMMRQPVRPQQPRGQHYAQRQLPGPAPGQDLGYDEYLDEGDFDGYRASEGDLIEDGFDDEYEDYDDLDEEDDDEIDPYDAGFTDSGDAFEDPIYDDDLEEEPEEQPRRRSRRNQGRSSNPLDGMSPEEVAKHMGEYIDQNPDKKGQIKNMAMGMAKKLL